jgi:MFS family permease
MVPLRLFRSNTFSGANLLTLLLYAALNSMLFFLPLNLIQIQGYNERIAGLTFVPFTVIMMLLSRWAGVWCDRRGAREPLTVGPLIAASGFLLLSLPGETAGASEFWSTFFPGITVFAIGMSITVAPLSTAVMGAVSEQRAGTASGINNAISRVAGVLSIAIMGSIVLMTFESQLRSNLSALRLQPETQAQIVGEAENLAAAQVPEDIPAAQQTMAQEAISSAFITAFRLQALIAAVLAGGSSVLAWIMLDPEKEAEKQTRSA